MKTKRKVTQREIKTAYKKYGNQKIVASKLHIPVSKVKPVAKKVREQKAYASLTKKDKRYLNLCTKNKVVKSRKEGITYIKNTKKMRKKEQKLYGHGLTIWKDPSPKSEEVEKVESVNLLDYLEL